MKNIETLKVAVVHDWLNGMRGGEKVLEYILDIFPNAPIYTLHSDLSKISNKIKKHKINNSFIDIMPFKRDFYRYYLPLFPIAIKQFDFKNYDLVISLSHCAAKNINIPKNVIHISYCFSPMRYIWVLQHEYFGNNKLKNFILSIIFNYLKKWDYNGAQKITKIIGISKTIQQRIDDCYNIKPELIYPPVDIDFNPYLDKKDYFLILSALTPYKKIDLVVKAFNELGLPLKIAGTGPEMNKLKKMSYSNIEFLGWVTDEDKKDLLKHAKALIFPGFEDFGIVPLEAIAFATPVIAYNKGGVTETVQDEKTGLFFESQESKSLINCIKKLDNFEIDLDYFKDTISRFSVENFKNQIKDVINKIINCM